MQTADENAGVGTPVEPDGGVLVPEGFEPLDGVEGLFFYSPEEDVVYYFSYCEFSEEIDGFYPADENGTVAPGTLPVTLDEEGNVLVVLNIDGEIIYVNAVVNISADEENAGEGDAAEDDNKPNPPSGGSTPRPTPTPTPTPTPMPTPTPTSGATPVISGPPAGSPSGMPSPTPTPGDEGGGNVSDPPSPTPEGTGGGENGSTSD